VKVCTWQFGREYWKRIHVLVVPKFVICPYFQSWPLSSKDQCIAVTQHGASVPITSLVFRSTSEIHELVIDLYARRFSTRDVATSNLMPVTTFRADEDLYQYQLPYPLSGALRFCPFWACPPHSEVWESWRLRMDCSPIIYYEN